jgi:uncharacterized lipoprotein YbaY
MKNRKIFSILLCTAVMLAGCEKDDPEMEATTMVITIPTPLLFRQT